MYVLCNMKVPKLIGFEEDVMKKLKKVVNASKLVNAVMSDYFYLGSNQKKAEIQALISKLNKEIFDKKEQIIQLDLTIKKIEIKDLKIAAIFKDIPEEIIKDFKVFPKMNAASLTGRYKDIWKKKFRSITYDRILKAFNQFKK